AETLGKAELKGRTFGDTEFVIGHSGSTVPERSGVALSFCGRRAFPSYLNLMSEVEGGETLLNAIRRKIDDFGDVRHSDHPIFLR
ncbi:hypothetical protein, partial [Pseudomonas gessardii]|uniref:hypothetical protein n=1 Tax=Pseudomonas gessardii TaxID=78544 RepID=UPI001CA41178